MAESVLEVIIKNTTTGTAAISEEKAAMSELGNTTVVTSEKTKGHAAAANLAAKEERDLTTEARESARAMGELGAKGGELVDRFGALTTAAGGLQGTLMGVALLAAGALVEGAIKVDESYREIERSTGNLKQATDATGTSFEQISGQFEDWINKNQQFVSNNNEARDALATFVRAGDDSKTSMDDLGIALDLSVGKHISLAEAAHDVILAEQGQGRALKDLGIDLASMKQSDDNATKAHKDYEAATKTVETAQKNLATAQEQLKVKEDELSGKHKLTAAEADQLAAAHKRVDDATQNLKTATDAQKVAQDNLAKSTSTSSQVHDEMHTKLDGLRNAQDQQQQATNRMSGEWDKFSEKSGPMVETALVGLTSAGAGLLNFLTGAVGDIEAVNNALNNFQSAVAGAISSVGNTPGAGAPNLGRTGVRAAGGPVDPGGTYLVGEAGPEVLQMGASGGYVVPSSSSGSTLSMSDTNDLLTAVYTVLNRIEANTRGPAFVTAAYGARG